MIDPCHKCSELCELDLYLLIAFLLGVIVTKGCQKIGEK